MENENTIILLVIEGEHLQCPMCNPIGYFMIKFMHFIQWNIWIELNWIELNWIELKIQFIIYLSNAMHFKDIDTNIWLILQEIFNGDYHDICKKKYSNYWLDCVTRKKTIIWKPLRTLLVNMGSIFIVEEPFRWTQSNEVWMGTINVYIFLAIIMTEVLDFKDTWWFTF